MQHAAFVTHTENYGLFLYPKVKRILVLQSEDPSFSKLGTEQSKRLFTHPLGFENSYYAFHDVPDVIHGADEVE